MDPLKGFVLHLSLEIGCKVAWTEGQGSGWWPNGKPLLFLVSLSVSLMFFFIVFLCHFVSTSPFLRLVKLLQN